jgi:hypothetical protein
MPTVPFRAVLPTVDIGALLARGGFWHRSNRFIQTGVISSQRDSRCQLFPSRRAAHSRRTFRRVPEIAIWLIFPRRLIAADLRPALEKCLLSWSCVEIARISSQWIETN